MAPFARTLMFRHCIRQIPRRRRPARRWVLMPHGRRRPLPPTPALARAPRLRHLLAYLVTLLLTGAGMPSRSGRRGSTPAAWAQVALVALALGLAHGALGLPVTLARGYWLPRRFGLLHQPLRAWLADRLKALLIGGASEPRGGGDRLRLIALTPYWWLVAAGVLLRGPDRAHSRGSDLDRPDLLSTVAAGSTRCSARGCSRSRAGRIVDAVGVFVADQSRKSRTANAAVVGIGRTRRIIVFDTLLSSFTRRRSSRCWPTSSAITSTATSGAASSSRARCYLVTARLAALGLDAGVLLSRSRRARRSRPVFRGWRWCCWRSG